MNNNDPLEIFRREQKTLNELLMSLQRERDAIISFSFEGLVRENNKKEEILKELEYLRDQKEKLLESACDREGILASAKWRSIASEREAVVREVKTILQKNGRLLSFSVDHVKSSIERIVEFVSDSAYGRKPEPKPLLLSKVV
jgi:flagellar biosynthesis/type III secretory pathway chaperone